MTDFAVTGTREALLRTVLEYPFDDLPRTIYADWLEEHGLPEKANRFPAGCLWACTMADFLASAAGMFAARPITIVQLTDKRAWNDRLNSGRHYWHLGSEPAGLPAIIFFRLAAPDNRANRVDYYTEVAADAALSRALVDYGRHAAGLRPIDWDTEGQS